MTESNAGTNESTWNDSTTIETRHGKVKGQMVDGIYSWLGIPFAKPPVGGLRWKAPRDPEPWSTTYLANEMAEPSFQANIYAATPPFLGSEDCLYLNVFRPATKETDLPVYFWIHGGGNYEGSASQYKGEIIAKKLNAVVVIIQYRLGWFGFFSHEVVRAHAETPEDASGNYALLDQIKALQWVKNNIKAFGGNPLLVTAAGQSAGARDISLLLGAEAVKKENLFQRAIHHSGAGVGVRSWTFEEAELISERAVKAMIKNGLGDQSSLSSEEKRSYLSSVSPEIIAMTHHPHEVGTYITTVDGSVFKKDVGEQLREGCYHKVPIMVGTTKDEFTLYLAMFPEYFPLTKALVDGKTDVEMAPRQRLYYSATKNIKSDMWRAKASDEFAQLLSQHQDHVYDFSFNWDGDEGSLFQLVYGASHGIDLDFFHGHPDNNEFLPYGYNNSNRPGRLALSDAIISYQRQFMHTGNPGNGWNKDQSLTWLPWSEEPGMPKGINLDADASQALFTMDVDVITLQKVYSDIEAIEDDQLREKIFQVVEQPGYEHSLPE
ncbi:carboxylesterase family protein [Pseudomaricurvus alkylphenolicus]|uniref:carboxylesterase/lipase family protein n=1 Tax=Pseudomaricurvus alkylphenolicus TaxID=1306991 RepID=UPI00141D9B8F|nr:carboxylesterase family protein [Pseudomaricurvus alkylphenolicus]NIB39015.1 carboxylesterase family protein [Pseudomaricurvus alkylphenolicus]